MPEASGASFVPFARAVTFGRLDDQIVVIVWTAGGRARRIISMRKANGREIKKIGKALG
jgi:uncharacterized DUF497 family protein